MSPARIALEVGTQSGWVSRELQGLGHEVIVANARKLRLIYENKRKDDRVDAEYLRRGAQEGWGEGVRWLRPQLV